MTTQTPMIDEEQILADFNYLHTRGETAFNEVNTTNYLANDWMKWALLMSVSMILLA